MGVGMVSETIANGHHWSPTCTVGAAPSIRSGTIGWKKKAPKSKASRKHDDGHHVDDASSMHDGPSWAPSIRSGTIGWKRRYRYNPGAYVPLLIRIAFK